MTHYKGQIYDSNRASVVEAQAGLSEPLLRTRKSPNPLDASWALTGAFTGFFVRVLSLKACVFVPRSILLSILSQADILLHAVIWISFFVMVTACKSRHRRHVLTLSLISLMVGVLFGSFLAWNFIDMTLGFPLCWMSRSVSFSLMLIQSWMLYRCRDMFLETDLPEDQSEGPSVLIIV